jgi:hypothetical protein
MKEKDLKTQAKKQTFVMYAEKDDGTYGTVESGSYLIENDLQDFWVKMEHIEQMMRIRLQNKEISPIHYFMVIEGLTPAELASRSGISAGRVKKHLTVKGFERIRASELLRYANVYNIPVANLFQVIVSSKNMNIKYHFYNKEENQTEKNTITQNKTTNPFIVITKVEEINLKQ